MELAKITIADSHFHQKIIDRYQKDKSNTFQLPHLIFLKNKRHISSLKINVNISAKIFNKISKILTKYSKNVHAKKNLFSLINIENLIWHSIFRRYPLEGDQTDNISLFQYHEKKRMQNTGNVWFENIQAVQFKLNNGTQSSFYPDVVYKVLLQGPKQPVSHLLIAENGSQNIQSFTYNTGQNFTKTITIPDKTDVPSSIIRNIHRMVDNRIQVASAFYPESVPKVLLQGEDQPISQYLKPEYGSPSIQSYTYNTGQNFTKTITIPDKRDVTSSIIRNIHRMVDNRIQVASAFYPEAVYKFFLQGEDQPISQYLRPIYGSQNIQSFTYNTGQNFTKTITIPDKTDVASSIIRNIHRMVDNRIQVASAFYPESVPKVLLQGEDQPISQYLKPEYGSPSIQSYTYNTGQNFTKTITIPDKRDVTSSIIRNIHRMVDNRIQVASAFYPEAVPKVLLQGEDQPISQYLRPIYGSQNIQSFTYNTGQNFTKTITIPDKTDVASSIIRNIHRMVDNRIQVASAFYPESVPKVLLQGEDQPISQYLKPEYGSPSIQSFTYNTGQNFTKTITIPDKRDVPSSIIRNIHRMVDNRIQVASAFYPEAVPKVLLQGEDQPISQYLRPIYGSQNIQSFTYNTGQNFTKTITIPDKTDVPSSIIRNIHRMVDNRIQVASAFYPEAVPKVLLQSEDQLISQYLRPIYGSQNIQSYTYNTGQYFTKTITIPNKTDIPSSIIRNIQQMVNNRIQVGSAFYPESVYKVFLQGEDQPVSQLLRPEHGSQNIQSFTYNTEHHFTKFKSIPDKRDVPYSIISNIHQMVDNRIQVGSAFYPESVYKVFLQGEDQPVSQLIRPEHGSQNIQRYTYNTEHHFTKINSIPDKRNIPFSIIRNIHQMMNNRIQVASVFYPEALHKVLLQGADHTFENRQYSQPAGIFSFPERPAIGTPAELLYFNDQRNVEQEIKEVKKIAIDAREAVRERSESIQPSVDTDLKKHLDVHWLSDQVYQNIEQRIRIEKERRGI